MPIPVAFFLLPSKFLLLLLLTSSHVIGDDVPSLFANKSMLHDSSSHRPSMHQRRSVSLNVDKLVRIALREYNFNYKAFHPRPSSKKLLFDSNETVSHRQQHPFINPSFEEVNGIGSYSPSQLQATLCREFDTDNGDGRRHVTNTFFVTANDDEDNGPGDREDERHGRLIALFLQLTSAFGIPAITWLPDQANRFEHQHIDHSRLILRLEPTNWHLARALIELLRAFNWPRLTVVGSESRLQATQRLLDELISLRDQRIVDSVKKSNFEIDQQVITFKGPTSANHLVNCTNRQDSSSRHDGEIPACLQPLLNVLNSLWHSDARIIVFDGESFDLEALLLLTDRLVNSSYRHIIDLFEGGEFVWIMTPSAMQAITGDPVNETLTSQATMSGLRKLPGLFGFKTPSDRETRLYTNQLVYKVWQKGLDELVKQLMRIYPLDSSLDLQTTESKDRHRNYLRQLTAKLRPPVLCQIDRDGHPSASVWQWGRRMYDIFRSMTFEFRGDAISFLPNGGLNVSSLYVYNSRISSGLMSWQKVGTWSAGSGQWGNRKSDLLMEDVTWSGGSNLPPRGRPDKFKLRVAIIGEEPPFVLFSNLAQRVEDQCEATSLACRVRSQSLDQQLPTDNRSPQFLQSTPSVSLYSINQGPSPLLFNQTKYVNTCCSGLAIDLLLELARDLDLDLDLFEVPARVLNDGDCQMTMMERLVPLVLDGQADLVVSSSTIFNRSNQLDFTRTFVSGAGGQIGIVVVRRVEDASSPTMSPTLFLKPFDYQCWCLILIVSVPLTGFGLYLFEWLGHSYNGLDRGKKSLPGQRLPLSRSLWLAWSMLFGSTTAVSQPTGGDPNISDLHPRRGLAFRFLTLTFSLFALLLVSAYTANLVAFMLFQEDLVDIKSMYDKMIEQPWLMQPPFRIGTVPSTTIEEILATRRPRLVSYMHQFNQSSVQKGLEAVKKNHLDAFLYDANVLKYWIDRDDKQCQLRLIRSPHLFATRGSSGYVIGMPAGSRWRSKLNERITVYQNNDKLARWKRHWLTAPTSYCHHRQASSVKGWKRLSLSTFVGPFALLVGGVLLSGLVLTIECGWRHICRHQSNQCGDSLKDTGVEEKTNSWQLKDAPFNKQNLGSSVTEYKTPYLPIENESICEELQMEADSLRQRLTAIESRLLTLNNRNKQTSISRSNHHSTTSANSQFSRPFLGGTEEFDRINPSSTSLTHRKSQSSSQHHQKPALWDVYTKVAVLPVTAEVDTTADSRDRKPSSTNAVSLDKKIGDAGGVDNYYAKTMITTQSTSSPYIVGSRKQEQRARLASISPPSSSRSVLHDKPSTTTTPARRLHRLQQPVSGAIGHRELRFLLTRPEDDGITSPPSSLGHHQLVESGDWSSNHQERRKLIPRESAL